MDKRTEGCSDSVGRGELLGGKEFPCAIILPAILRRLPTLYSATYSGGANTNGVVLRIGPDDSFKALYTFSASDPITGSNADGSSPYCGLILDGEDSLIGASPYGGNGNSAGFGNTGGTLYRLKLDD